MYSGVIVLVAIVLPEKRGPIPNTEWQAHLKRRQSGLRGRARLRYHLLVSPKQHRRGDPHTAAGPQVSFGPVGALSKVIKKNPPEFPADQRADTDGKKGESHVGA